VIQIDRYGRALIKQGRFKEALEVFEINLKRYAAHSISRMGMAYGHSAFGDYKKALKFAKDALSVETNSVRKAIIESAIKKLEHAQDIN
jgi:tetratricopeptide (TPR) repeat protein